MFNETCSKMSGTLDTKEQKTGAVYEYKQFHRHTTESLHDNIRDSEVNTSFEQQIPQETHPNESDWTQLNELIIHNNLFEVRNWFDTRGLLSGASQFWTINSCWPLQIAAKKGSVEIFDALLDYGFDPMEVNFFGDGLVHTAAAAGHTEIVERLFQLGLFVSVRDEDENTPLHYAAMATKDNSTVIKFLVERRADPNAMNCFQETPLHMAARKGSILNVGALIASGACVNVRSSKCPSPLFYAMRRRDGIEEHVQLLCDMGAISGTCQRKLCEFYAASTVNSLRVIANLIERNFCMSCGGPDFIDSPLFHIVSIVDLSQRERTVDMIMQAGYVINHELPWVLNEQIFSESINEMEVLQKQLKKYTTMPRTLRQISCFAIRKILGPSLPFRIDYLPLPDILKDVVRLRHVIGYCLGRGR